MRSLVFFGAVLFAFFVWSAVLYTTVENQGVMTIIGIVIGMFSGYLIVTGMTADR